MTLGRTPNHYIVATQTRTDPLTGCPWSEVLLYDNYPTHKNYDPVTKKYNRYYSHLVGDYPPPFERHGTAWAKDFMRRACNLKVHHWGATIEPVTDSVRENLGDLVASGQVSVSHDGKRKIMVHEHVRGLAKLRTPIDVWWIELYEVERKYVGPNAAPRKEVWDREKLHSKTGFTGPNGRYEVEITGENVKVVAGPLK